jgi:hypothetical protein
MRVYKVNGIEHKVFDADDKVILPSGSDVVSDWREGRVGDWVRADDDCVVQILRRGKMHTREGKSRVRGYIGTCTGTFPTGKKVKMDTSRRINIYSFGGDKKASDILIDRSELTSSERMFVIYVAQHKMGMREAYMKAFNTKNPRYALQQSGKLIQTKRVSTAMKEELKPVLEELKIDDKLVLKGIKDEAIGADKADTRLKALFKLSDILDLEDKTRTSVQQITGAVFKGFEDNMLEEIKRPEELEE